MRIIRSSKSSDIRCRNLNKSSRHRNFRREVTSNSRRKWRMTTADDSTKIDRHREHEIVISYQGRQAPVFWPPVSFGTRGRFFKPRGWFQIDTGRSERRRPSVWILLFLPRSYFLITLLGHYILQTVEVVMFVVGSAEKQGEQGWRAWYPGSSPAVFLFFCFFYFFLNTNF